jgi:cyclase
MSVAGVDGPDVESYPYKERLASGVFAFVQPDGSWGLSNAGLICSDDVVVLVDTWFTERRNRVLREVVLGAAPIPPTIIVNTHHHGDHVYGNGWFPEAVVISHVDTRGAVLELDPVESARRFQTVEFGETRATPATITFETSLQLHVGDMAVDVFFPGVGHCPGNTAAFIPQRSVLFAGDLLLKNCTPTMVGGSALGYLSVLDRLRQLVPERIVTGHGPTCSAEVIDETERYVQFILELAADALAKGRTPLDAARAASLGEFDRWLDSERIVGNLYRAMHELGADNSQLPMDSAAMWRDTEALLGRPLRSRA